MSKQTALDWYWEKIKSHFEHDGDLFETASFTFAIAKQKEREQIIEAYATAVSKENNTDYIGMHEETSGEIYYNETYKGGEQ